MATPTDVFVNCPFDDDYRPLLEAYTFVVHDCGLRARCSLEANDGGDVRIDKIKRLIRQSRFGIHDISRTELDSGSGMPRFNMPLELGIYLGARSFGDSVQRRKVALIFERRQFSYQTYCSDISGQDVYAHGGDPDVAIVKVRDWLATNVSRRLPGGVDIKNRFRKFQQQLPEMCESLRWQRDTLPFRDFQGLVVQWLRVERQLLAQEVSGH